MNGERILITGGAGFLGSHLAEALLKQFPTAQITILDNFISGTHEHLKALRASVQLIEGDIRDRAVVEEAARDVDYIFHLAAMPFIPDCYDDPEAFITANVNGTYNLLRTVIGTSLKAFIHMSTSEVYGSAQYVPIDEKHPTLPRSTYAASKLAAENIAFTMAKEHKIPLMIMRSFNFYGPRDTHPRIIPEIIIQFSKGNVLQLGNINASRDFVYVTDVAQGLILAALTENARGQIINLATGKEILLKDLIDMAARVMHKDKYELKLREDRLRPFDVDRLCGSANKAKEIIGWVPAVSIEEGFARTLAWYSEVKRWPFQK